MQDTVLVKVNNLSRQYGQIEAVADISFEARRGEVLGFLGPNGAGKTSTMQMLTGNLAPSQGQILVNTIDLLEQPKLAKAEIGYLPEQPPLYRDLTVDEYLHYCLRLHAVDKSQQRVLRSQAKQRCGLNDVGQRLIGHLSKGYQQRVGIAQAIIHQPSIIILDEPTVGLDPIQIREIRQLVRDLGERHCVILSTHILPEVQAVCDRVQIINDGKLIINDSVNNLDLNHNRFSLRAVFQQPPQIDLLEQIDGVLEVQQTQQRELTIQCQSNLTATEIAALAVQQSWGLLELSPQQRNLEELFVDIISGKQLTEPAGSKVTEEDVS